MTVATGAMNLIKSGTSICSALCIGGGLLSGQKIGSPIDFINGAIGLKQEDYYDGHGAQSGTFMEALGGTTDNFVAIGTAAAIGTKKGLMTVAKTIGKSNVKYMRALVPAFMTWQALQGGDELLRGDGDPIKDKMDVAGNIFNILLVGAAMKKGNFAKSWTALKNLGTKIL
jgi:hypothetical protein